MTSVLVTGGTGLPGGGVTRALAADGHTVRILSRTAPGLPVPGAETVVGDLGTGAGLLRAVTGTAELHGACPASAHALLRPSPTPPRGGDLP